jgi:PBP1b-binding outer membrane lipoprotein LpoB
MIVRVVLALVGAMAVLLTGCSETEEPKAEEKPVEAAPVETVAPAAPPADATIAADPAAPAADQVAPDQAAKPEDKKDAPQAAQAK